MSTICQTVSPALRLAVYLARGWIGASRTGGVSRLHVVPLVLEVEPQRPPQDLRLAGPLGRRLDWGSPEASDLRDVVAEVSSGLNGGAAPADRWYALAKLRKGKSK